MWERGWGRGGEGRPGRTWVRKGGGGDRRGGQKGGQGGPGSGKGEEGGTGGDGTGPAPGPKTPRGKFGKEPWEKERHEHEHGTAAADARALGTWGSLSVSMSKRVKSAPGGVLLGGPGGVWVQDPQGPSGLRTLNSDTGGGEVPRKDPLPRGFF